MSKTLSQVTLQRVQKRFYQAWALTELVSHPSRWIYLMGTKYPWLNNTALSVVSGAYDPKLLLTGLRVETWTADRVGLVFTGSRRLQKDLSLSDLTAAAEHALRIFWNRFLVSDAMDFTVISMQWDGSSQWKRPVKIRYGHPPIERDQILFELGSSGQKTLRTSVLVLNDAEIRLGTFEFEILLKGPLSLS